MSTTSRICQNCHLDVQQNPAKTPDQDYANSLLIRAWVSCSQAYKMQQKGKAVLVDVREAKYYGKGHAGDCVNVGLFRSVEGRTPLDNLKRLAMAGFAMEATGKNVSN